MPWRSFLYESSSKNRQIFVVPRNHLLRTIHSIGPDVLGTLRLQLFPRYQRHQRHQASLVLEAFTRPYQFSSRGILSPSTWWIPLVRYCYALSGRSWQNQCQKCVTFLTSLVTASSEYHINDIIHCITSIAKESEFRWIVRHNFSAGRAMKRMEEWRSYSEQQRNSLSLIIIAFLNTSEVKGIHTLPFFGCLRLLCRRRDCD